MTASRVPLTLSLTAPVLTLLLLAGVEAESSYLRRARSDAAGYHARIAAAASAIPLNIGPWVGQDVAVPRSAVAMLRPNVVLNRRYTHAETGEHADLLFVQCEDARDLVGHFPPICYPSNGFQPDRTEEKDWLVGSFPVHGKRYRFTRNDERGATFLVVDNFMILPGGATSRDMDGINRSAQDLRKRHLGAAQVQVLTDAAMDDQRRDQVFTRLVEGCLPAIREMSPGVEE